VVCKSLFDLLAIVLSVLLLLAIVLLEDGQTIQWPKEEVQTIQWPKEEVQTIQWPKEEVQTIQWPKEEVQTIQWPKEKIEQTIKQQYKNINPTFIVFTFA
jgi:hypothetical protein